jgi:hypothetical protein
MAPLNAKEKEWKKRYEEEKLNAAFRANKVKKESEAEFEETRVQVETMVKKERRKMSDMLTAQRVELAKGTQTRIKALKLEFEAKSDGLVATFQRTNAELARDLHQELADERGASDKKFRAEAASLVETRFKLLEAEWHEYCTAERVSTADLKLDLRTRKHYYEMTRRELKDKTDANDELRRELTLKTVVHEDLKHRLESYKVLLRYLMISHYVQDFRFKKRLELLLGSNNTTLKQLIRDRDTRKLLLPLPEVGEWYKETKLARRAAATQAHTRLRTRQTVPVAANGSGKDDGHGGDGGAAAGNSNGKGGKDNKDKSGGTHHAKRARRRQQILQRPRTVELLRRLLDVEHTLHASLDVVLHTKRQNLASVQVCVFVCVCVCVLLFLLGCFVCF